MIKIEFRENIINEYFNQFIDKLVQYDSVVNQFFLPTIRQKFDEPKEQLQKEIKNQNAKLDRIKKAYLNGAFDVKEYKEEILSKEEKEIEEILRTFNKAPSPSSENSVQNQAQQNNKQPRQISQKPTNTERTARTSNQTEYKRQAQSSKMDIWFENK